MDVAELLDGDAPFVADTSAWWRVASLPEALGAQIEQAIIDNRFWITPVVAHGDPLLRTHGL